MAYPLLHLAPIPLSYYPHYFGANSYSIKMQQLVTTEAFFYDFRVTGQYVLWLLCLGTFTLSLLEPNLLTLSLLFKGFARLVIILYYLFLFIFIIPFVCSILSPFQLTLQSLCLAFLHHGLRHGRWVFTLVDFKQGLLIVADIGVVREESIWKIGGTVFQLFLGVKTVQLFLNVHQFGPGLNVCQCCGQVTPIFPFDGMPGTTEKVNYQLRDGSLIPLLCFGSGQLIISPNVPTHSREKGMHILDPDKL